jgi:carbohydrate-selective porin OprB
MASANSKQVLLLLAAVACLASLASATQWTVGDVGGWRAKFNETGWTDGKTFTVGDTLRTYARHARDGNTP